MRLLEQNILSTKVKPRPKNGILYILYNIIVYSTTPLPTTRQATSSDYFVRPPVLKVFVYVYASPIGQLASLTVFCSAEHLFCEEND